MNDSESVSEAEARKWCKCTSCQQALAALSAQGQSLVTPEMIEAGLRVLQDGWYGQRGDLAKSIYLAMHALSAQGQSVEAPNEQRREALREMTRLDEEMGLYDDEAVAPSPSVEAPGDDWRCINCKHVIRAAREPTRCPNCRWNAGWAHLPPQSVEAPQPGMVEAVARALARHIDDTETTWRGWIPAANAALAAMPKSSEGEVERLRCALSQIASQARVKGSYELIDDIARAALAPKVTDKEQLATYLRQPFDGGSDNHGS